MLCTYIERTGYVGLLDVQYHSYKVLDSGSKKIEFFAKVLRSSRKFDIGTIVKVGDNTLYKNARPINPYQSLSKTVQRIGLRGFEVIGKTDLEQWAKDNPKHQL